MSDTKKLHVVNGTIKALVMVGLPWVARLLLPIQRNLNARKLR